MLQTRIKNGSQQRTCARPQADLLELDPPTSRTALLRATFEDADERVTTLNAEESPDLDEQQIELHAAAQPAEYQQDHGVVITRQVPIEDIWRST